MTTAVARPRRRRPGLASCIRREFRGHWLRHLLWSVATSVLLVLSVSGAIEAGSLHMVTVPDHGAAQVQHR